MKHLLTLCLVLATAQVALAQRPASAPAVIVATAEIKSFPLVAEALGNASANESVSIRPVISALLTKIHFEEGQSVEAGATLAELENVEALALLAAAKASLVENEAQYRRLSELYRTQAVSQSQVQSLEAQRDASLAAVHAAEARLAHTVIKAPFSGRLGLRRVSVGSLVGPDTVITTLDDTHKIKLDFDVPEVFIARLEPGMRVVARSVAWPGEEFTGEVQSVDTRVDPASRTVAVRALVDNSEGRLRAGMFLTVIMLKENIESLMIPEQALVPERSTQSVIVVTEDSTAEFRVVKTGRRRPGEVEILSGLEPSERIIIEGTQKARPGQPVTVLETRS
jgi:membrane fusion protein (multidrug efflux system)